jgi:CubicO group peptidase (beta-lactamase class C family)
MAVVTPDRSVFAGGLGASDLATGALATARTQYLWFSMTKIVTATAILRLADQGLLDLDAPACEHVPALATPRSTGPTVRQLLNHTAGLSNPLPLRWVHAADEPAPDPDELLARLLRRRRAFTGAPGGPARYSNVGYLALGAVVAAAAGRAYEDYVMDAVLAPAGMTRTRFRHSTDHPAATGYVRAPRAADPVLRRILPAGVTGPRHGAHLSLRPFTVDGPSYGGLVGDVVDAARFARLHLEDGALDGQRVLQPSTTRVMRVVDRPGNPFSHGLGWFRASADRSDYVEHWGAGAGFWNVMRLYPEAGLGVVLMTNSTSRPSFEPVLSAVTMTVT